MVIISLACWFETRSPFFIQQRIGLNESTFNLIKFRTMKLDTPSVATHLADKSAITRIGQMLRASKLDELPQLWNVFRGAMSIVGPRPCLVDQQHLIRVRRAKGIFLAKPGITGLAQVNKIDMSNEILLAEADEYMIRTYNTRTYFKYIILTVLGKGYGDAVR